MLQLRLMSSLLLWATAGTALSAPRHSTTSLPAIDITVCTITCNKQLCTLPYTTIPTLLIKWRQRLCGQHGRKNFQDWVLLVVLILCGINGVYRAQHLTGNVVHLCNWIHKVNIQALLLKAAVTRHYRDAVEMLVVPRINIFGGHVSWYL